MAWRGLCLHFTIFTPLMRCWHWIGKFITACESIWRALGLYELIWPVLGKYYSILASPRVLWRLDSDSRVQPGPASPRTRESQLTALIYTSVRHLTHVAVIVTQRNGVFISTLAMRRKPSWKVFKKSGSIILRYLSICDSFIRPFKIDCLFCARIFSDLYAHAW